MGGRYAHFYTFAAVLALAPLPFGLNRPLSWTSACTVLAVLGLVWPFVRQRRGAVPTAPAASSAGPATLFLGVAVWIGLQAWPGLLPSWAHPLWAESGEAGVSGADAVAVAPYAAETGLLRLTGYALAFWLALRHGLSRRRAARLLDILAGAGGIYALYGLVAHLSGSETLLWFDKWAYEGYLTGTFVNRNSYAAFAGLSLLCALAAVFRRLDGERLTVGAVLRHLQRRTAFFILCAVLIALSLPASGSRAGVGAGLCGLLVFVVTLGTSRNRCWRPGAMIGLAGLCLTLAGIWGLTVSGSQIMSDLGTDRLQVYELTLGALAERPWTGHGLGAFPHIMQGLRTPAQNAVWTEVHNTYLELALELGLPAAAALLTALVWSVVRIWLGLARRTDGRVFLAVGLASSLQIALHSMVDFVAQIPAVTLLWMALLGLAVARADVIQPTDETARRAFPESAPC